MHQNDSFTVEMAALGRQAAVGVWAPLPGWGNGGQAMPIAFGFTKMEVPFRSSFRKASWFHAQNGRLWGAHLQAGEQVLAL